MTDNSEIKQTIKAFLSNAFRDGDAADDDNIFTLGYVSSLFAMELVLFVEKTFEIKIEDEDLDLKNFCSVNAITEFVENKKIQ